MEDYIATEIAYTNGYNAGKAAAAEQIFGELDPLIDGTSFFWLKDAVAELKKKYGVD